MGAHAAGHAGATFTVPKQVAVFNVGGTIYAMGDGCLHHGPSLGSGKLEGKVVTCRAHGWRCDVTTGSTLHALRYGVACQAATVVDGEILPRAWRATVTRSSKFRPYPDA